MDEERPPPEQAEPPPEATSESRARVAVAACYAGLFVLCYAGLAAKTPHSPGKIVRTILFWFEKFSGGSTFALVLVIGMAAALLRPRNGLCLGAAVVSAAIWTFYTFAQLMMGMA